MSRLAALIDQAADGTRPLSDVLRQLMVVASRINDAELSAWASKELAGYGLQDDLPSYRASRRMPVHGIWTNPLGMWIRDTPVSSAGLPEDFDKAFFYAKFRQSVAELEMLSGADSDASLAWDPWAVGKYNQMVEDGEGGTGFTMMSLMEAHVLFPRNVMIGILDSIRTQVLDLALALEQVAPDAGEPNGPTVNNPQVGAVVQNFNFTINGDGANVATGDHAHQRSTVKKGDARGLVEVARGLGLSHEDAESFREAVEADGTAVAEHTRGFVARVRDGGVVLLGNASGSLAATGLIEAASMFFGG